MENNPTNSPHNIDAKAIKAEAEHLLRQFSPVQHQELLQHLLKQVGKVDFRLKAKLEGDEKLGRKHFLVICIEEILIIARRQSWGICQHNNSVYLYNGAYWSKIDEKELQSFLGEAAEKMGVYEFDARLYTFKEQLYRQFLTAANLPKPKQGKEVVLINLLNGTFEISPSKQILREHRQEDFLTYQLPFTYDPTANALMFEAYLQQVQPDLSRQHILAEFLGYLFIRPSTLKLEKALLLYGTGANGKSVFFEIVFALLGAKNVSNYSLQSLTNENGYYRAKLDNKLLNYASELNGKLEASTFKQIVSGEPVEARLPYGNPFLMEDYAKLIFNCNELPKDVEQTHAFFRRFLIVPFEVTIPEAEQDRELSKKIIEQELSGIFNWVLQGLNRLLRQKKFTYSEAVEKQLHQYQKESDNVLMFLEEEQYQVGIDYCKPVKDFYQEYRAYCSEGGYRSCNNRNFKSRLFKAGFQIDRKNFGYVVYFKK